MTKRRISLALQGGGDKLSVRYDVQPVMIIGEQ